MFWEENSSWHHHALETKKFKTMSKFSISNDFLKLELEKQVIYS